ncbi:hypothetical protein [Microviridae sp.]|nr:hypothetical protein [Microviridae sp.]
MRRSRTQFPKNLSNPLISTRGRRLESVLNTSERNRGNTCTPIYLRAFFSWLIISTTFYRVLTCERTILALYMSIVPLGLRPLFLSGAKTC